MGYNRIRVKMFEKGLSIPRLARAMQKAGCSKASIDRVKRMLRGELKDEDASEIAALSAILGMTSDEIVKVISDERAGTMQIRAAGGLGGRGGPSRRSRAA